jgi:hypothetical protein
MPFNAFADSQITVQLRMGIPCGEIKICRSALGIETHRYGDRFNKGGFADAVFPDKEGHTFTDRQLT